MLPRTTTKVKYNGRNTDQLKRPQKKPEQQEKTPHKVVFTKTNYSFWLQNLAVKDFTKNHLDLGPQPPLSTA